MIIKYTFLLSSILIVLLAVSSPVQASEFLTPEQIKKILEMDTKAKPLAKLSAAKNVYFCWSKPDHPKHVHAYEEFAKSFAAELSQIEDVQATAIEGYPTGEQWKSADLVVFNLTLNNLSAEQFAAMDAHLDEGGAVIVIHQGLVQRKGYEAWAKRIGLAFSWDAPPFRSKWGKGTLEISLDTKHEIFEGFPDTIRVNDELYWNLASGEKGKLSILGETAAPKRAASDGDTTKWPAFWTVEHPTSKEGGTPGRVFCCVISHPNEVAFSSSFKIVMMRAIAWGVGEPTGPFLRSVEEAQ